MVHSVAGLMEGGRLVQRPPYREPHHSASQAALTGGGPRARPGEVSLAHRGVLSGRTTVARANAHVTYPARFQLVAAMNPCRCGHLGDASRECGKAPRCGEDYLNRISGPLLDRIDMTVAVQPIPPVELSRAPAGEGSAAVAARVAAARTAQRRRGGLNAEADAAVIELAAEARVLVGPSPRWKLILR
jgi:magnesium chelatase family protein